MLILTKCNILPSILKDLPQNLNRSNFPERFDMLAEESDQGLQNFPATACRYRDHVVKAGGQQILNHRFGFRIKRSRTPDLGRSIHAKSQVPAEFDQENQVKILIVFLQGLKHA